MARKGTDNAEMASSEGGAGIARAASLVALGNISSRVLGLARETISASLFGASGLVSAFGVASIIPRQLYDLLIGGMMNSALVPIFSEYAATKRREELWRLFSLLISLTSALLVGVVLLLELGAPLLTRLLAGGFSAETQSVTLSLVRVMLPSVLLLNLAGLITAFLYAQQRFVFPALSTALYNASIIAAMLLLSRRLNIYSLGVGVLGGAALQMLVQLPGLRGGHFSLNFDLRHPALRRILALYSPILLGLVVSFVQVTIDRRLASGTGESSIAYMDKATTLVQSAHGLVAVAISTAVLPALAAANARADLGGFRRTLGASLRLSFLLIVPLALGLFVLAEPLIALLFQHGAFNVTDTFWTAAALRLYLLGLIFATIDWPLNYAFYARQDTLTPALVGIFSVGIYLVVALALVRPRGMLGLVLADSAKHFSHALTMLFLAERRMAGLRGQNLLGALARIIPAALLMAITIWILRAVIGGALGSERPAARLALVVAAGGMGAVLYGGLMLWRGPEEARTLYETVKRRIGRKA